MDPIGNVNQDTVEAYERLLRAMVTHPPTKPLPWVEGRWVTTTGKVLLSVWTKTGTWARAIARQLNIGNGAASDIVDLLVQQAHLARRYGEGREGDRRYVMLEVTEEGEKVGQTLAFPFKQTMVDSIRNLSPEDAEALGRILNRMAARLEDTPPPVTEETD